MVGHSLRNLEQKLGGQRNMNYMYILTIWSKNHLRPSDVINLAFDNEKEARKAFHNSVSKYGIEYVTVTKEVV